MTDSLDPRSFQLLLLGGAKASTHGDDQKPLPEDEETSFEP
ncbi:MAG: hypothetical protein ACOY9C_13740 [Pseudomonadota bacterium]